MSNKLWNKTKTILRIILKFICISYLVPIVETERYCLFSENVRHVTWYDTQKRLVSRNPKPLSFCWIALSFWCLFLLAIQFLLLFHFLLQSDFFWVFYYKLLVEYIAVGKIRTYLSTCARFYFLDSVSIFFKLNCNASRVNSVGKWRSIIFPCYLALIPLFPRYLLLTSDALLLDVVVDTNRGQSRQLEKPPVQLSLY